MQDGKLKLMQILLAGLVCLAVVGNMVMWSRYSPSTQEADAQVGEVLGIVGGAFETAGYVAVRTMYQAWLSRASQEFFEDVIADNWGQRPRFERRPWDEYMTDAAFDAGGLFLEGFVQGVSDGVAQQQLRGQLGTSEESLLAQSDECWAEANNENLRPDQQAAKQAECEEIGNKIVKVQQDLNLLQAQSADRRQRFFEGQSGALSPEVRTALNFACNPSLDATLQISLGLAGLISQPVQPVCRIDEALTNWQGVLEQTGITPGNTEGWNILAVAVDPYSSELGLQFNAFNQQLAQVEANNFVEYTERIVAALSGGEIQSVDEQVSGYIKTPGSFINNVGNVIVGQQADQDNWTGNVWADLITVTIKTLSQSLLGATMNALTSGLTDTPFASLYDSESYTYGGIKAAKRRTAKLTQIPLRAGGELGLISEFTSDDCDSTPNACVMGNAFAQAVTQKMTVRQAMAAYGGVADQNNLTGTRGGIGLNPDGLFGFTGAESYPDWQNNYPYDSLVVLRKYRVIPVTWEYAALYIKEHPEYCSNSSAGCTLKQVVDEFDVEGSPFYGLVDPDWVLKLPVTMCELKGPGPQVEKVSEDYVCKFDTNGDGQICCTASDSCRNPDELVPVERRLDACVDQKTCLLDDANGKCLDDNFGYCLEEKRIWRFQGETCDANFNTCRTVTNDDSGRRASYLTSTIPSLQAKQCNTNNSGCAWYSDTRSTSIGAPWESDEENRVYFNGKVATIACRQQAEGCQNIRINATNETVQRKIAPASLDCSYENIQDEFDGKRPAACEPYLYQCSEEHQDCELFTPTNRQGNPIAGANPNSCEASCVGLAMYSKQATSFDAAEADIPFIGTTAQQCSAASVGCDEFTSLNDESLAYFSYAQSCEALPENPSVFYTWYGSDTSGTRLTVVNLKADSNGTPTCRINPDGTTSDCTCSQEEFESDRLNPLDRFYCREFINTQGEQLYLKTDKIVYQTDDCTTFRRTKDGQTYDASPRLSKSCTPQAAGCREYHGTKSGNYRVVFQDTFESNTNDGWTGSFEGSNVESSSSNESKQRNGHSLKVSALDRTAPMRIRKSITPTDGGSYTLSGWAKGPSGTQFDVAFTGGATIQFSSDSLNDEGWKKVAFSVSAIDISTGTPQYIEITASNGTVYFDDLLLRETQGILYAIENSWNTPQACQAAIAEDAGKQIGCSEYRDRAGNTRTFTTLRRSCPVEAVGCTAAEIVSGDREGENIYIVDDGSKSCGTDEVGCTAYGLPALTADGNIRTAPRLGVEREVWQTKYFKIEPSQAHQEPANGSDAGIRSVLCDQDGVGCRSYDGGQLFFKDPGQRVCTWQTGDAGPGWYKNVCQGTDNVCRVNSDCGQTADGTQVQCVSQSCGAALQLGTALCSGTNQACGTDNIGSPCREGGRCELFGNQVGNSDGGRSLLYCMSSSGKVLAGATTGCSTEGQACSVELGEGVCTTAEDIISINRQAAQVQEGWVAQCPSSENGCRLIRDPECRADGTLRTNYGGEFGGDACQATYYVKEVEKGECNGVVDPQEGCILFSDPNEANTNLYDSAAIYNLYKDQNEGAPNQSKEGISLSSATGGNQDANAVYRVNFDRACNTWLACTATIKSGPSGEEKDLCLNRVPCRAVDGAGNCTEIVTVDSDTDRTLNGNLTNSDEDLESARSLSGLSRPNFEFQNENAERAEDYQITGGHDGYFSWPQVIDLEATEDRDGRLVSTIIPGGVQFITNSCRLYPQSDAPYNAEWSRLTGFDAEGNPLPQEVQPIDACYYQDQALNQQNGVYGFCLEPYPNYEKQYTQFRSSANGYTGHCLNWLPVDYIDGQYDALNTQDNILSYEGPKPLYYCMASKGARWGFESRPASTLITRGYKIKTRDTSVFRFANLQPSGNKLALRDANTLITSSIQSEQEFEDEQDEFVRLAINSDGVIRDLAGLNRTSSTEDVALNRVADELEAAEREKALSDSQYHYSIAPVYAEGSGIEFEHKIGVTLINLDENWNGIYCTYNDDANKQNVFARTDTKQQFEQVYGIRDLRLEESSINQKRDYGRTEGVAVEVNNDNTASFTINMRPTSETSVGLVRKMPLYCFAFPTYEESVQVLENRHPAVGFCENCTLQEIEFNTGGSQIFRENPYFTSVRVFPFGSNTEIGNHQDLFAVENMVRFASASLSQVAGFVGTVKGYNETYGTGALARGIENVKFQIAAIAGVDSIRPEFGFYSGNVEVEEVVFSERDVYEGVSKSISVRSKNLESDDFGWRAVYDKSSMQRIQRASGDGFLMPVEVVETDDVKSEGRNGENVTIRINREAVQYLGPGSHVGIVRVYAMLPREGIAGGETQRELRIKINATGQDYQGINISGLTPPESPPERIAGTQVIRGVVELPYLQNLKNQVSNIVEPDKLTNYSLWERWYLWQLNRGQATEKDYNIERIDSEANIISERAPVVGAGENISITLKTGSLEPVCGRPEEGYGDVVRARLIYKIEGSSEWKAEPSAVYVERQENWIAQPRWLDNINCGENRTFPSINIGTGGGVQYYFVIENIVRDTRYRTELKFIDVYGDGYTLSAQELNGEITTAVPTHVQPRTDYEIPETPFATRNFTPVTLNFSLNEIEVEGRVGWTDYFRATNFSTSCGDSGCCTRWRETMRESDFRIAYDSVESSNDPNFYRGEQFPWLDNATNRLYLEERGGNGSDGEEGFSNEVVAVGNLLNPDEINEKYYVDDEPYNGSFVVEESRDTWTRTCRSGGGCGGNTGCPSWGEPSRTEHSVTHRANLLAHPQMQLSENKIEFSGNSAGSSQKITVESKPYEAVYHWRAQIKDIEKIPRPTVGEYSWLSLAPAAGMSGTELTLTVNEDVNKFAKPGDVYSATVEIYATTPVDGPVSRELRVDLVMGDVEPIVFYAQTNEINCAGSGCEYNPGGYAVGTNNVIAEESTFVMVGPAASPTNAELGIQTISANDFEADIAQHEIAQIDYIIEHRTRETLPGFDWTNPEVVNNYVVATEGGCAEALRNVSGFDLIPGLGSIVDLGECGVRALSRVFNNTDDFVPNPRYDFYTQTLEKNPSAVISTTDSSDFTMVVANSAAQGVNRETVWSAACQRDREGRFDRDFAAIQPVFDKETKKITSWKYRYCDNSDDVGQQQVIFVSIVIHTKDYCTEITQTAMQDGESIPWRERVKEIGPSGTPIIPLEGSDNFVEAINPPPGVPEQWPAAIDVIRTEDKSIAHAQPISAIPPYGVCSISGATCNTSAQCGSNGGTCLDGARAICIGGSNAGNACQDRAECGSGICVGVSEGTYTSVQEAQEAVQNRFGGVYDYWVWDENELRYRRLPRSGDLFYNPPTTECSTISIHGDDCYFAPEIRNLQTRWIGTGNTVELRFNTFIDEEQKPLKRINIDWGDGSENTVFLSSDDKPSVNNRDLERGHHTFTHTFGSRGSREIVVSVEDNWGKVNSGTISTPTQ